MTSKKEEIGKALEETMQQGEAGLDALNRGISAVKDQIQTVRDEGMEGVKDEIRSFTREQPLKALAIAGGIGALTALIIARR